MQKAKEMKDDGECQPIPDFYLYVYVGTKKEKVTSVRKYYINVLSSIVLYYISLKTFI